MLGDNSELRVPGDGCEACRNTGYRGRVAVQELLPIDDTVRSYIMQSTDAQSIREISMARGMRTIRDDGAEKVRNGVTSVAEVLRVTAVDVD
jgi:type II secretory ATPase GspE/PulE/Tfp pilus assembly ATPase PilB-like protein